VELFSYGLCSAVFGCFRGLVVWCLGVFWVFIAFWVDCVSLGVSGLCVLVWCNMFLVDFGV